MRKLAACLILNLAASAAFAVGGGASGAASGGGHGGGSAAGGMGGHSAGASHSGSSHSGTHQSGHVGSEVRVISVDHQEVGGKSALVKQVGLKEPLTQAERDYLDRQGYKRTEAGFDPKTQEVFCRFGRTTARCFAFSPL
jgi:hypothetical protein